MITIYHNPRCSKSRQGLALLENSEKQFEIVRYLENKFSEEELNELLSKLNMQPIELVRKNEAVWKAEYKNKTLSNQQIIEAMVTNPKLIERPIVVNEVSAVVGRPTEKINDII